MNDFYNDNDNDREAEEQADEARDSWVAEQLHMYMQGDNTPGWVDADELVQLMADESSYPRAVIQAAVGRAEALNAMIRKHAATLIARSYQRWEMAA